MIATKWSCASTSEMINLISTPFFVDLSEMDLQSVETLKG